MFLKWEIYLEKSPLFHRLLWKDRVCLSKVAILVIWAADRRFLAIGQVSNVNHWKFWPTKEGNQDALACLGGVRWLWLAATEQGCYCAWEQVLVNFHVSCRKLLTKGKLIKESNYLAIPCTIPKFWLFNFTNSNLYKDPHKFLIHLMVIPVTEAHVKHC